ncbi:MAG: acyltransferase [Gammaproteobacteria bacterium]|nr:acyltransferase [Gammaproteobacteria bacterium]
MHLLKGILACISIGITTVAVCVVLFFWWLQLALASAEKNPQIHQKMDRIIVWWTSSNRWMLNTLRLVNAEVHWQGREHLSPERWYLVVSNHQSWVDILLLQTYLLDDIPALKFFTKSQLIWLPFIGQAMYVLGFPYVKRVNREQIKNNPELRNADRDNVLNACERFKNHPTSILNFAEGTRRTDEKHQRQGSQFKHLLKPKIGGITYILQGMDAHLDGLVDVTIVYPDGVPTFWDLLQGKCGRVIFDVRYRTLEPLGAEGDEVRFKSTVAQWVNSVWAEKDARITHHLESKTTD